MVNWQELVDKYKLPLGLILVGIVLIIGGLFISTPKKEFPKESLQVSRKIKVDVSGQVNKPGVYELGEDSRIQQAIDIAGGFTDQVNTEYISKQLNLAQKITDGTKIYIPNKDEKEVVAQPSGSSKQLNINTAGQDALESLSGVGSVTATKIIEGRPYQNTEELVSKKVLSKSVFEKLKNNLVVY